MTGSVSARLGHEFRRSPLAGSLSGKPSPGLRALRPAPRRSKWATARWPGSDRATWFSRKTSRGRDTSRASWATSRGSTLSCRSPKPSGSSSRTGLVPPLISFDIDGTLEVGDPPGLVSVEMVRECKRLGYLIGSCSDRPVSYQRQLWERLDIPADLTVLQHRLADVRLEIDAEAYFHIGDTELADFFAGEAGCRFFRADSARPRAWGPRLVTGPP